MFLLLTDIDMAGRGLSITGQSVLNVRWLPLLLSSARPGKYLWAIVLNKKKKTTENKQKNNPPPPLFPLHQEKKKTKDIIRRFF